MLLIVLICICAYAGLSDPNFQAIFIVVGKGLIVTLRVTIVAFAFSFILGTGLAFGLVARTRWLSDLSTMWVEFIRGLPILVLLYAIAFVVGPAFILAYGNILAEPIAVGLIPSISIRDFDFEWRAIIALALAHSAFIAEIMRGGIDAVPQGQKEAAIALGLSHAKTLRSVVLPQAFKIMLPPLGNNLVSMLKDSSLVSVLGIEDITQNGKIYSSATFLFFETYSVVALFYLLATIGLSLLLRRLEQRLQSNERR